MQINFFEEYPTKENLDKLKLIKFKSTVYIAHKSFSKFKKIRNRIEKKYPNITIAYWPLLEKSYWISPFAYTYELKKLFEEVFQKKQNKKLKVLLDLELPILKKSLFIKNFFKFRKNKNIIKEIFCEAKEHNIEILTAEYPSMNLVTQKRLQFLGVSYPLKYDHKKIIMYYSSMIKLPFQKPIRNTIIQKHKLFKKNLQVGLGTIATGVFGNEPILAPEELEKDLEFLQINGIKTAVIFRLGGINKKYLKIIKRYL